MRRTFNLGIGMVLVLPQEDVERSAALLRDLGEKPYIIGELASGKRGVEFV
jgi:phosphoribosylformylglycinamidine cyclo-ligase